MIKRIPHVLIGVYLTAHSPISMGSTHLETEAMKPNSQYLEISVDKVVINTNGLVSASNTLADSIDALARAIVKLSADGAALTPQEREAMLGAVNSVDRASAALSELALRLPEISKQLMDELPRVVDNAREPIAEISRGLELASDSIHTIVAALPQATVNARELVNSSLNAVLIRASIFAIILIVAFLGALIWTTRYLYQNYLDPVVSKLDALVGAPEHFANLSKHMKQTSDNLLLLQNTTIEQLETVTESRPAAEVNGSSNV